MMKKGSKIALIHDFLIQFGGAERVLEVLCEMYPDAPIYTLLYDQEKMRGKFAGKEIHTSFLQKFPKFLRQRHKYLLPFMPTAPETFDLRDFDLVISSSGAWSKGIVTRITTTHVAYIHSPMRFVWDANEEYLRQQKKPGSVNFFSRLVLNYLRVWDKLAADRPDHLIANSSYTEGRIRKYYGRESTVIYPPAEIRAKGLSFRVERSAVEESNSGLDPSTSSAADFAQDDIASQRHFLVVSRLSPYKNIDKVIEAFNKLDLPLVVIGQGDQEQYLRKIAGPKVKILGWQDEASLAEYYAKARAFVFACVEDFGMAMVEAMAYGLPVVALRKGGAEEIIIEGRTGEFFDAATPEVIADGVRRLIENENKYERLAITDRAKDFSKERFMREFREYMETTMHNSKIIVHDDVPASQTAYNA